MCACTEEVPTSRIGSNTTNAWECFRTTNMAQTHQPHTTAAATTATTATTAYAVSNYFSNTTEQLHRCTGLSVRTITSSARESGYEIRAIIPYNI